MPITTDQYQRLMNFMDGIMSLDETLSFEKELANNTELRAQLDFEQRIRDDISSAKNINGEFNDEQSVLTVRKNKYFSIKQSRIKLMAAVIIPSVIIAGVAMLLVHKKNISTSVSTTIDTAKTNNKIVLAPLKKPADVPQEKKTIDTESLFKKYYKKEPAPEEYPILLAEAFDGYARNNYAPLDKLNLQELPDTRGSDDAENKKSILLLGNFYKGAAALERKKTTAAIEYFTWVINHSKGTAWQEKAQWYLAMAFLQKNDISLAQKELEKLTEPGKYRLEAKQILKTISSD